MKDALEFRRTDDPRIDAMAILAVIETTGKVFLVRERRSSCAQVNRLRFYQP